MVRSQEAHQQLVTESEVIQQIDFHFTVKLWLTCGNAYELVILLTMALPFFSFASNRPVGKAFASRSEVIAQQGMACTSQPLATQAALDVLKQGGSAVNAAIAANAVLGVVEPMSCGIGGDLFAIVWDTKTAKLHGLNASGRSPAALKREHFVEKKLTSIPKEGPLPVSVPGCVDGWIELHKKFGKLPLSKVLAPAMYYANNGYPVTEVIAEDWRSTPEDVQKQPGFKGTFMPNGHAPAKGEIFVNRGLGRTLERIAKEGRAGLYNGEVAETIGKFMKKHGGFLAAQDLAGSQVRLGRSGFHQLSRLRHLGIAAERAGDRRAADAERPGGLTTSRRWDTISRGLARDLFIEAKKLAFADRAKYLRRSRVQQNSGEGTASRKNTRSERRKLIDSEKARED